MRHKVKKSLNKKVILIFCSVIAAFILGAIVQYVVTGNDAVQLQKKYNLIAKRTLIDNPNDVILNFNDLKKQLAEYSDTNLVNGQASIYFEYLPTGTSIGFNEDQEFTAASLLKTPLAINLYKSAEQGKIDLDKPVALKKEWLNDQYGDLYKKGEGHSLTLRQAAKIMLEDSDNTAAQMISSKLLEVMPINDKLLSFIDIPYGVNNDSSVKVGSSTYSSMLKCLYFSCYTNKDSSQEILKYLTQSKASNRLKLYLPEDAIIAHKIGVYDANGQVPVQSDCGIVYVPSRNYLLCVMVKGDDPKASRVIGDISKITYDFIATYN